MKKIQDLNFENKNVLIRVDLNVPIDLQGRVKDLSRVEAIVPTVKYVLEHGGLPILMTHFGRPKGVVEEKFVLTPLVKALSEKLGEDVVYIRSFEIEEVISAIADAKKKKQIVLLENLRFHLGEEANDPDFSELLASFGEVYVNDAFSVSHRAHASVVGVPKYNKECAMGLHFQKEFEGISPFINPTNHPVSFVLGGVKLETKVGVLTAFIPKADNFLFGGGLANTFLAAKGVEIGKSVADMGQIDVVRGMVEKMKEQGVKIFLPSDVIVSETFDEGKVYEKEVDEVGKKEFILDIGKESQRAYAGVLSEAKTIICNGTAGRIYRPGCEGGMKAVIEAMVANKNALKLIGGGDSLEALRMFGISWKNFTYVSTSGGAMLEFLEKGTLVGIEAL